MKFILQSWNYRDYSFGYACRQAGAAGWEGLELHPVFINPDNFVEEFPRIRRQAADHGLPIYVFDLACVIKSTATVNEFVRRCAVIVPYLDDTDIVIINSTLKAGGDLDPALRSFCFEQLRSVADLAADHGIGLTLEIHLRTLHETAAQGLALLDEINHANISLNLDSGNLLRAAGAEDPLAAVRMLGSRLGHLHAKNLILFDRGHRFTALEEGQIDYARLLLECRRIGYQGFVAMENGGPGCPDYATRTDAVFLKRIRQHLEEGVLQ